MCVWVEPNRVADPAKQAFTNDWFVVGILVAIEALLAEGHPYSPQEWLLDSEYRYFENRSNKPVGSFRVRDGAEVFRKYRHLRFLVFRKTGVLIWSLEAEARRALVDLIATTALESEYRRHVGVLGLT